jgi:adenine deaminase
MTDIQETPMTSAATLTRMIMAGQGKEPADLVIKNVRLLDVITGAVTETDIAIVGDRIVGTHASYEGKSVIMAPGALPFPVSSTPISTSNPRWSRPLNSTAACCRTA